MIWDWHHSYITNISLQMGEECKSSLFRSFSVKSSQWRYWNIFVLLIQLCTQHFHVSHVFSVRYKCREILGENMQRRSAEVEFNQRKGGALVHRTSFNWPIQQTLYKPVFAYWDTQVCDKRNLLAQIMLGFYVILCKNHSKPWSLSKYPFTKR